MSIRQNFPTTPPSLVLDFANSKRLDPRITFSRTTTATRMNELGLIETVDADIARFDHKYENGVIKSLGLLVEESRENLVNYSESFDSWTTGNVDVGINTTTAPDGTQSAESLIERDQNYSGGAYRRNNVTIGTAYSGQLTYSVFLKAAEVTTVGLIIDIPELGDPRANVNLTSSTTSGSGTNSTYKVESFLNGWKRVSVTSTNSLSNYTGTFAVAIYLNGYVGFDNTGNYGDKVYVWGAQLERGAFPTSYIPTSGGTATRNPDNASITGDNFSDWYNPTEGTVLSIFNTIYEGSLRTGTTPGVWGISQTVSENNTFNGYGLTIRADTRKFSYAHRVIIDAYNVNVSLVNFIETETIQPYTKYKVSCSYADNELKMSPTGQETLTRDDANYGLLPKTTLFIGNQRSGGSPPYELTGHISQLTYYPRRLSNSQLQNLTK